MAMAATTGRFWSALALALTVSWLAAACGGGGGGGSEGSADGGAVAGGTSPPGTAIEPTPNPPAGEPGPPRIEPYERSSGMAGLRLAALGLANKAAVGSPWEAFAPAAPVEVRLGPLPASTLQAKQAALARPQPEALPREIGQARAVPATADPQVTTALLAWAVTASGGQRARLRFRADGAAGLRLALQVTGLPDGAVVRVSGGSGEGRTASTVAVDAATIARALSEDAAKAPSGGDRLYWLPPVAGEAATLEIELPPGCDPATVRLAVPRLAHLWWTHAAVTDATALKVGQAGSCNVDATCDPEFAFEARSVARIEYVDAGSAFLCTGTLMADTARSGVPYFLTANHCIRDQAAASSISTFWFYRAAGCNVAQLDPAAAATYGGGTLLYASGDTDTAFIQLRTAPPAGAVHAGSLLVPPTVGASLATLHHPGGDLLKLSQGSLQSYAACTGLRCTPTTSASESTYLGLRWASGTTDSGSSGSPALAAWGSHRYVVGQLFAGSASCTFPDAPDYYGRFDKAYPNLRQWLGEVPGT